MSRMVSKLAITAGAAALALSPVAVSAGTRASDNSSIYSNSGSQPGKGRSSSGESVASGISFVSILIGAYIGAWTTLFVAEITEDDDFQSAGV